MNFTNVQRYVERCLLILAVILCPAALAAFLFYVSALSILSVCLTFLSLVIMYGLGYYAGTGGHLPFIKLYDHAEDLGPKHAVHGPASS